MKTEPDNSILVVLFKHNAWANLKLLDYCQGLTDEQLNASAPGTYGTIRETLRHIVRGEVSYVVRVNGKLPQVEWPDDGYPSFEVLKQTAQWTSDELLQLAQSARADTIVREEAPELKSAVEYKLASLIMQAINHANEHRAHVSTIITQLGLEPPDMSGWVYMEEIGEFREFTES